MNLIILDDESRLLYGHQLVNYSLRTSNPLEAYAVRGVSAECYVVYVSKRFPDCKEVQELLDSRQVDTYLLEQVSDRIELTEEDGENIMQLEAFPALWRKTTKPALHTPKGDYAASLKACSEWLHTE